MLKVSIVTPSYNQAHFLEETIQSILSQDYPDIEYIIVDGGSTDGSQGIIRKYASRLAYWVSEPDSGQSEAINKGFARATGDILTWICSDDTLLPGAVSTIVDLFQKHPGAGLIYGDAWLTNPAGERTALGLGQPYSLRTLVIHPMVPQPAGFFSRRAWEIGGPLDTGIQYAMDRELWLRMAGRVPIIYEPVTLATMRYHPDSKSVRGRASTLLSEKAILDNYFSTGARPQEAVDARPISYSRLYYNLGMNYSQQGKFAEARAALKDSIRWQPWQRRTPVVLALLAFAMLHSGWLASAYPSFMGRLFALRLRLQGRV